MEDTEVTLYHVKLDGLQLGWLLGTLSKLEACPEEHEITILKGIKKKLLEVAREAGLRAVTVSDQIT